MELLWMMPSVRTQALNDFFTFAAKLATDMGKPATSTESKQVYDALCQWKAGYEVEIPCGETGMFIATVFGKGIEMGTIPPFQPPVTDPLTTQG